jgi:PIN domain nuclease of toxin-antitoxin system
LIVLDSHIWFWWINLEHKRFSTDCRQRIEQSERVGVSPVSCYELALAHRRGRLQLPCSPGDWFREALEPAGVELLQVTAAIAARAVSLTDIHRDPFDRLIIATALENDALLASVDGLFVRYPELEGRLIPRH